jgi:hypothetical protein
LNKTVPSPTNWPDDPRARKLRAKKSGIRAIDQGTSYDVSGRLRRLIHQIEDGKHGHVTDIVLAIRCITGDGIRIRTIYTGSSEMARLGQMIDYLKKDTIESE